MRPYAIPFAAILALAIAVPSRAAEKPRSTQGNQNQPKKVWTNDDTDHLRARGLISIAGAEANEAALQAAAAPSEAAFPVYNSRLEDPAWYAEKAASLQAVLEKRQAALLEQKSAMSRAADGVTRPGIAMDQPNAGVTPEAGVTNLAAQVQEVQSQLDELSDLARQNNIPPGILRG